MNPTAADKKDGLKAKYKITHTDGAPCDPEAKYFVLRLDNHEGMDAFHVSCCREAAKLYAQLISSHLPKLSRDLLRVVSFQKDKT